MNIFYDVLGSRHKPVIKSYKNIIGKKSARLISRHKSPQEILANQIQQYIWREVIESRQAFLFENSHLSIITPTPMTKLLKASPIFVHLCLLNSSISSLKIFLTVGIYFIHRNELEKKSTFEYQIYLQCTMT